MREMLERAGIGQTELAFWLGVTPRSIRRYLKGDRPVPPSLALLLEYWIEHPETKEWFRQRAERSGSVASDEESDADGEV